ncbi:hypothetical protein BVRB_4g085470 [Beta vulgaris subsp. vulgaris]|nr:hypothetical protein BVRB_4g085470 [Beta vulgaris subsp. vulgaris]
MDTKSTKLKPNLTPILDTKKNENSNPKPTSSTITFTTQEILKPTHSIKSLSSPNFPSIHPKHLHFYFVKSDFPVNLQSLNPTEIAHLQSKLDFTISANNPNKKKIPPIGKFIVKLKAMREI